MLVIILFKTMFKQVFFFLGQAILLLTVSISVEAVEVSKAFRDFTLNANLELAEGEDFEDSIVLIVHGYSGHNKMEIIHTAQRALLDNDQSSLAINLSMGIDNRHGFFDCTWPHRYLQEDTLDEISTWVDWLRDRGVSRITLLAHSRGANQAMVYAVDNKDPEVTQLVLLAPGTFDDTKQAFEERYGPGNFDQQMVRAEELIAAGQGTVLMENTDIMICPQTSVSAGTFNSFYGKTSRFRNFRSYLPRIPMPTLVITGTQDERSPDIAQDVADYVDGKRLQLSVIEGAGHFFRDFNIDEAMEAVIEFIDDTRQ
jgi:pimeloyl-ACP methyl ester carboxylesterase